MPREKTNGFMVFAQDWKKFKEAGGRHFRGGMQQVVQECGPDWKVLEPYEKKYYKKIAEERNGSIQECEEVEKVKSKPLKSLSFPKRVTWLDPIKVSKEQLIAKIVGTAFEDNSLPTHSFHIVSACQFERKDYQNGHETYLELAVVEFTIQDGIVAAESFFMDTSDQPVRSKMATDATLSKEMTKHQQQNIAEFKLLLQDVSGEYEPIFGFDSGIRLLEFVLPLLISPKLTRVLPLSLLIHWLSQQAAKYYDLESGLSAELALELIHEMKVDNRDLCLHHEGSGNFNCALARAKRSAYTVASTVAPYFGVECKKGQHIPVKGAMQKTVTPAKTVLEETAKEEQTKLCKIATSQAKAKKFLSKIDSVDEHPFTILTFNRFLDVHKGAVPAEMALVRFTFKHGIIGRTCVQINPGKLPLGLSRAAKELSEATHHLPLPPGALGKNYAEALVLMLETCGAKEEAGTQGNETLFVMEDEWTITERILDAMVLDVLEEEEKIVKLLPLAFTFSEAIKGMQKGAGAEAEVTLKIVSEQLHEAETRFVYYGCEFHEKEDEMNRCCALTRANCWANQLILMAE